MPTPEARLHAEIEDLHRFFVRWYGGTAAPDEADAVLARFRDDFRYVFPGGRSSSRDDLAAMLASSHGANPQFRIRVEQFDTHHLAGSLWAVTYKEFQSGARNSAPENGRISSAVFSLGSGSPVWLHLHETWLPDDEVAAFHHANRPLR